MNLTASLGTSKLIQRKDFVAIEPGSYVAALTPTKDPRRMVQHDGAGLPTLVIYARFVAWAIEQAAFPMPEQVVSRFHTSRATAHRWLNALAEAYAVDRPKRDSSGRVRAREAA